ncbi:MAG: cobyric acid synthase [Thermodesulfovibrionales bacterium]|nr:cobyric acid synthase [Thermodesulfovibrionales bacterium]
MSKSLMIQGTGSGVGKSIMVMALCRLFVQQGLKVAPFKAQNMALNSFITKEGGEIGRAQALQSEAAGIEPSIHMNPVLLKASGDLGSQVIIQGKVHSNMTAKDYYKFRDKAWEFVRDSYKKLSSQYELIILEGAGSPAEINLMDVDIVNMKSARLAKSPIILIGDIDKGGVFASLYGTVKLVGRDSHRIKCFVINKFRGDLDILKPGLDMIYKRTGRKVIGVLPYIDNFSLPEEDGLSLKAKRLRDSVVKDKLRVVVVHLKYIANFTDFDPLMYEPDVELLYSLNKDAIVNAHLVIIPGTKNTVKDLLYLRELGLDESIKRAFQKGISIIGICGGYQMLGKIIRDPLFVESTNKEVRGIGLLNIETIPKDIKTTCQLSAKVSNQELINKITHNLRINKLHGYEIHMGISSGDIGIFEISRYGSGETIKDGSMNNNCFGTYIHGIFENDEFRRAMLNKIRVNRGYKALSTDINYRQIKEQAIENITSIVKENLDLSYIRGLIHL